MKKKSSNYTIQNDQDFRKHIIKIVSVPIVLILFLIGYNQFQSHYLSQTKESINKYSEAQLLNLRVSKEISDMSLSFSSFITSGDEIKLMPYISSVKEVDRLIQKTTKLVSDDDEVIVYIQESVEKLGVWKRAIEKRIQSRKVSQKYVFDRNAQESLQLLKDLRSSLTSVETELAIKKKIALDDFDETKSSGQIFQIIYIIVLMLLLVVILSREVIRVISSYKMVLEENLKNMEGMEKASKAKDLFLANMSHEIRTPLGAIIGFSDLVCQSKSLTKEELEHASFIQRNSRHLLSLVDDMFDISKINASKIDIELSDCDIFKLLEDIENIHLAKTEKKLISLKTQVSPNTPNILRTDETRLKQILSNLIGNAVKFSRKNSEIKILVGYSNGKLTVDVIDNGIGISKEAKPHIFKSFSQEDNSHTRFHGGAGLGLSISKRLAKLLGGDLKLLDSSKNKGSHFRLVIKAKVPMIKNKKNSEKSVETDSMKRKVLLVEDSKENQVLFGIFLKSAGINYTLASNGQEALEKIKEQEFDLVLMDIQMPVMDGFQAITHMREEGLEVPVIAITAHTLKGEREKCFDAGFNDFLSKPLERDNLLYTIEKYV